MGHEVAALAIVALPTLGVPFKLIAKPVETQRIDGVEIVFELTPGAEAPAEMIMYYPQFKVLNMAEIATQNFHNLLPMRGAQVRDPLAWSKYIGGALQRYGAGSEVLIAQHDHAPLAQRAGDHLDLLGGRGSRLEPADLRATRRSDRCHVHRSVPGFSPR